jgi:hypothetical protein
MATTTNYSWTTPDDTALVKDGAAAIRALGTSIDTTTKNLNPSTTLGDIEYRSSSANTNTRLGIGTTGQILTVAAGVPSWATLPSATNKNYLINGGFAVAQRGTSFTSTGGANNDDAYTLDRWYILSDGNDAIDVTQDTTTVPTNGEFAIALDVETVNKKFGIATIIENADVIGLVGNTVTFSFKAKVSATTKLDNVKAAIVAWSGTADTVTSDIISAWGAEGTNPTLIANATYENTPANLNLTTSYATYSITAPVDTASTQNIILFIWSDVTDTTLGDFVYIAESKLELGSTATAFEYAGGTFGGEVAACQRYFQKSYQYTDAPGTVTNQGSIMAAPDANVSYKSFPNVIFPTIMRSPTTLTVYNPATGVAGLATAIRNGATNANQPIFLDGTSQNGFQSFVDNSATSTGNQLKFHYTASAEL